MKFDISKFFTMDYVKRRLLPALAIAALAGYTFYTLVKGTTYANGRKKIDDVVDNTVTAQLVPVIQAFTSNPQFGFIASILATTLIDIGDSISASVLPTPAGKLDTDAIADNDVKTVAFIVGIIAFVGAYFGADAIAEIFGVNTRASNGGATWS